MPQYVYLKLGYDADKTTEEDAIAMLNECGAAYPEFISLEEIVNVDLIKEQCCCRHMAGAVKKGAIKVEYSRPNFKYLVFNDCLGLRYPKAKTGWVIQFCPFCGTKIGSRLYGERWFEKDIKKPLCTEIYADPELAEVPGSTKETKEVRQRERLRIATCPLKSKYRCQWDEPMKCPKCGSEMKCYHVQTQPRAGYPTDIELQEFQCTNPRCLHKQNKRREVEPAFPNKEELKGATVLSVKESYLGEVIVETKNNKKIRIKAGICGGEPTNGLEYVDD